MPAPAPVLIRTIADYHRRWGLPQPAHPLVSLIRFEDLPHQPADAPRAVVHHFYSLALKRSFHKRLKYGQQAVDFDQGLLLGMAPRQVLSIQGDTVGELVFKPLLAESIARKLPDGSGLMAPRLTTQRYATGSSPWR